MICPHAPLSKRRTCMHCHAGGEVNIIHCSWISVFTRKQLVIENNLRNTPSAEHADDAM